VKQQFEPCRMRRASLDIIEQANTTITEYQADGYALTVRQLYYQFVGRGLFTENSQKMYDKLGRIISDGRKCGLIDWDVIVDRTRSLKAWPAYGSPSDLIDPSQFDVDRWTGQAFMPEVWVEKEALLDVVQRGCSRWGVPFFACRGFASDSSLYEAGQRMRKYSENGQYPVVFHLGDHDPSGMDMTVCRFHFRQLI